MSATVDCSDLGRQQQDDRQRLIAYSGTGARTSAAFLTCKPLPLLLLRSPRLRSSSVCVSATRPCPSVWCCWLLALAYRWQRWRPWLRSVCARRNGDGERIRAERGDAAAVKAGRQAGKGRETRDQIRHRERDAGMIIALPANLVNSSSAATASPFTEAVAWRSGFHSSWRCCCACAE